MRTITLLSASILALSLANCGAPSDGMPDDDNTREAQGAVTLPLCRWWGGRITSLTQDQMNRLYYGINPTPHSEIAYQGSDASAPIARAATIADASGRITVLQTSLYNRDGALGVRYGSVVTFAVHTPRGTPLCQDSAAIPFRIDIPNLSAGRGYYIQPLTLNTQAKILPTNLAL